MYTHLLYKWGVLMCHEPARPLSLCHFIALPKRDWQAFYGRKLFRNWERMYDLKIPEICRGYCETEGYSISIIDYPTFSITTSLWASVVWTLFGRETAQCLLETSIVFYFEMFQHSNYTYRNGLVSWETHPKCHCDFPTNWYSTCLWHWLAL